MRRNDTSEIGRLCEDFAISLLQARGFAVRNLNDTRKNYPLHDLVVTKSGRSVNVSVKCARAKRELRLGAPHMLAKLADEDVLLAFLPMTKGVDIQFMPGGYELLIVPGMIARDEALAAHNHYAISHPASKDHTVMIKDKIDRNESTKSGAVFKNWQKLYRDAWHVLEGS